MVICDVALLYVQKGPNVTSLFDTNEVRFLMEIGEPAINNTSGNYGKYLLQLEITGVVFFLQETKFFPILIETVGIIVSLFSDSQDLLYWVKILGFFSTKMKKIT